MDEATRDWLDERETADDRPSRSELAEDGSYVLSLTVSGVKDEHAAYVASQLHTLTRLFKLDGTNVEANVSAERNRDGVERVYELIPDDGSDHPF